LAPELEVLVYSISLGRLLLLVPAEVLVWTPGLFPAPFASAPPD